MEGGAEITGVPKTPESPDMVFEQLGQKTLELAEEIRGKYGFVSDVEEYDSGKFMWGFASDGSVEARTTRDAAEGNYINPHQGITILLDRVTEKPPHLNQLKGHTVAHGLTDEFMKGLGFFPEEKGFWMN